VIAAADCFIEIGVIDLQTKSYHRVDSYDVTDSWGRVKAFVGMINIFRVLHTMMPYLPDNATPFFRDNHRGDIVYYPDYVVKKIQRGVGYTCPEELYALLANGAIPSAVTVKKGLSCLKIYPRGTRIANGAYKFTEIEVCRAVKAVLRCLMVLHQHDFVHRNIHWANLVYTSSDLPDGGQTPNEFYVIDFEFAEWNGEDMMITDYLHEDVVSSGNPYYARHDLQLVGKLVRTWATRNSVQLSTTAWSFVDGVSREVDPLDATRALQHDWLQNI
jgi:hypothetical protein